jgi:hypothetical protein
MALAAKGSNWTVINCSAANCYGVDSAGGSFVNGAKTAGAVEWDIFTAGGYTGVLSQYLQYNRILSPRDHRQNHQVLKPRINSVGGTIP